MSDSVITGCEAVGSVVIIGGKVVVIDCVVKGEVVALVEPAVVLKEHSAHVEGSLFLL